MIDLTPDVSSPRGAPMGRDMYCHEAADYAGFISIRYLPFVDQYYDRGGAYWGTPADLYGAGNAEDTIRMYMRARSRAEVVEAVRAKYPRARIRK